MEDHGKIIKQLALEVGFTACGIGRAEALTVERERLYSWLAKDYHGEMQYLAREPEKRLDPCLIMDGAKSIIMLAYHYAPDPSLIPDPPYTIARFALGLDYHVVLKEKMNEMILKMKETVGSFNYRIFTDSAPVLEKAWAVKTGLGWVGKNSIFQLKGKGSWFLLCEIITDLELSPDEPYTEQHCGNCKRCLEACPADALIEPYILDARLCLTYQNFENIKETTPTADLKGRLYGCDICQEVCPFNKPLPFNKDSWLKPNPALAILNENDWDTMDENKFAEVFKGSGIFRNGYSLLVRNLQTIKQK